MGQQKKKEQENEKGYNGSVCFFAFLCVGVLMVRKLQEIF